MIKSFLNNQDGATAIEYGLITAIVALGIVVALSQVGSALNGLFGIASAGFHS